MHLDPTTAQIFIDGYKHVLSMIHSLEGLKRAGSPTDRLIAARARLAREPFLLDQALETLENRRGSWLMRMWFSPSAPWIWANGSTCAT